MSELLVTSIYNQEGEGAPSFPKGATVTGVITATSFSGSGANLTGIDATALKDGSGNVKIQANSDGAVVTGVLTAPTVSGTTGSFTGNVSVGGTLTYEDVTNVDSVGMITARNGVKVLAGGINAVGVITATSFTGSGANLTGIDAAPTVDVVASGTLATDDAVFFNVSGTVSKVVVTSVPASVGTSVDARGGQYNSVSQWEFDSCKISDNTFAICWEKDGIKVVVGTVSGTSITFGTILNTGNGTSSGNDFPLIDYCVKSGCIALAFKNGSNLSMRALGVSGNSLTEGSLTTISNTYGTSFALACGNANDGTAGPTTGGLVYGISASSANGRIHDFTISGTTVSISPGGQQHPQRQSDLSNTFRSAHLSYNPYRDAYVFLYNDNTSGLGRYLWQDSLNRNNNNIPTSRDNAVIAAGSATAINTVCWDSVHQKHIVAYVDNTTRCYARKIAMGDASGGYQVSDLGPIEIEGNTSNGYNMIHMVFQPQIEKAFMISSFPNVSKIYLQTIGISANGNDLSYNSSSDQIELESSYSSDKVTLAPLGNGKIVTTIPNSNAYQVLSSVRQYAYDSQNITPSTSNFLGFSSGNYTNGQTAKIKIVGNTTTQTGLSTMSTYFITGIGTVSSTAGSPSIKAGYAINTTTMIITPQYIY